jgi:hypothetical protein
MQLWDIPISIELPLRFGYDKEFKFVLQSEKKLSLEKIHTILYDSICFMDTLHNHP